MGPPASPTLQLACVPWQVALKREADDVRSPNCRQRVHYEAPSTSYDSYGRDVATDPNRQHTPASNTHLNTHLNVHWVRVIPCVCRRPHNVVARVSTVVLLFLR
jgi:hypothetical protein